MVMDWMDDGIGEKDVWVTHVLFLFEVLFLTFYRLPFSKSLGGGFYSFFNVHPYLGEMIQFDYTPRKLTWNLKIGGL